VRHSLLLILIVLGPIAAPLAAQTPASPPTVLGPTGDLVIASGQGIVKRAPNQAFVTVASEARSRQPGEAQAQNARVATAIRARLAGFKLPDDAVRTMSVDMQPEFDWANGKQTLKGYLATNVIEVRLDDVASVGDVVDGVIGAGATRVAGVRFTLKDMAGAEQQALELASAAALARAKAMASGVGRNVDRVVRLDETGGAAPPPASIARSSSRNVASPSPRTTKSTPSAPVQASVARLGS